MHQGVYIFGTGLRNPDHWPAPIVDGTALTAYCVTLSILMLLSNSANRTRSSWQTELNDQLASFSIPANLLGVTFPPGGTVSKLAKTCASVPFYKVQMLVLALNNTVPDCCPLGWGLS